MLPPKTSEGVTNWVTAGMAIATHGDTKQAWHTISVYQLLICFPIFKAVRLLDSNYRFCRARF